MRILFVTNSLGAFGGIEFVTIVKANALTCRPGIEVAVAFTDKGSYPQNVIHPISEKVRVVDLGVPFWDLTPLNVKNLLVTAPRKFLSLRKSLKAIISDFSPDVVVSTGSYEKFALASLRLPGVLKVREFHFGSTYRRYHNYNSLFRMAEFFDNKMIGRLFDLNMLLTKADMEDNFSGNTRFDYHYNPCSIQVDVMPAFSSREHVIVAVARLEPEKGVDSILRIWHRIYQKLPNWHLRILGRGSRMEELKKLCSQLGLDASVEFMGHRKDVMEQNLKARILMSASKFEGFGLNIVEAMKCGVVPVAYNCQYGPSDIITDGVDGFLVPPGDEEGFAHTLLDLCLDEHRQEQMSEVAIKRASDFDLDAIIDSLIEKYRLGISKKRGEA